LSINKIWLSGCALL